MEFIINKYRSNRLVSKNICYQYNQFIQLIYLLLSDNQLTIKDVNYGKDNVVVKFMENDEDLPKQLTFLRSLLDFRLNANSLKDINMSSFSYHDDVINYTTVFFLKYDDKRDILNVYYDQGQGSQGIVASVTNLSFLTDLEDFQRNYKQDMDGWGKEYYTFIQTHLIKILLFE
jgi:hypothetical protein